MKRPKISVAIPTWEVSGLGPSYLDYSFNILANQTFKDFEVVISDHSMDDFIKSVCASWGSVLDIKYYENTIGRGKIAPNLNNAIRFCNGSYIKILFQDDFLYDENSLNHISSAIDSNNPNWIVTACVHTKDCESVYDHMIPFYHDEIYKGINTISCPTVLTIKNDKDLLYFDESLNWLVDVEYYKRLYDKFGLPLIVTEVCAVNRDSEVRTTNMMTSFQKNEEAIKVSKMYD